MASEAKTIPHFLSTVVRNTHGSARMTLTCSGTDNVMRAPVQDAHRRPEQRPNLTRHADGWPKQYQGHAHASPRGRGAGRGGNRHKCLDCGKKNPKWGIGEVRRTWCGDCAQRSHPDAAKQRTFKERTHREDRGAVLDGA
jgi:hypothetical protein